MNNLINHGIDGTKFALGLIIASVYKIFKKKDIYIVGERKDQCQDNGYYLFKYIRENHEDDKVYYCITKDSNQLDRIKSLGNIVYYKSFKHYILYILSKKLICAHVGSCTPDTPVIWKLEEKKIINKKRMFIQHGITKELISSLMYKSTNFETFICGAKPEYEFVKNNFGYKDEAVKYLGLCRFDNLHNFKVKKQILLMPTWRQWFGMSGINEMSREDFKKSDYFKKYNALINNKKLHELLKDKNLELIFYPHHEMQRYIDLFNTISENIVVARENLYDVQILLKESQLLITDYSSIAFDFAYMRKPIIYYQFDDIKYYKSHYEKGYFDYERDGFGKVTKYEDELISSIDEILKNKVNRYMHRIDNFFILNDKDNCRRHYQCMMNT